MVSIPKKSFLALVVLLVSSCAAMNPQESAKYDVQQKVDAVCLEIKDTAGRLVDTSNEFLRYDKAIVSYERTGLYGDTQFDENASPKYFRAWSKASTHFVDIEKNLSKDTQFLRQLLKAFIDLVDNPSSVINSRDDHIISSKWNDRTAQMRKISKLQEALCASDSSAAKGFENSSSDECPLECMFSSESEIFGIAVPKDAIIEKIADNEYHYNSKAGSVAEFSKYYIDALPKTGWRLQVEESRLDPSEGINDGSGFWVQQSWCRKTAGVPGVFFSIKSIGEKNLGITTIEIFSQGKRINPCL